MDKEGVKPVSARDIRLIEELRAVGHCGEGHAESQDRRIFNRRIDNILANLRIAARVLDPGMVEKVALVLARTYTCASCGKVASDTCCEHPSWTTPEPEHQAQTVLSLLRGDE